MSVFYHWVKVCRIKVKAPHRQGKIISRNPTVYAACTDPVCSACGLCRAMHYDQREFVQVARD
jgi:hypothetical protein